MAHIAQRAVGRIRLKKLYLDYLMPENQAHQGVRRLVHGRTYEPRGIADRPPLRAEIAVKRAVAQRNHLTEQKY